MYQSRAWWKRGKALEQAAQVGGGVTGAVQELDWVILQVFSIFNVSMTSALLPVLPVKESMAVFLHVHS